MRSLAENQDVAGLHKMPTGVEGFDAITGGGLPRNRTSLILGGGKTVFALQTLVNGAHQFGEPGIFVAFEENSRHILANAATTGAPEASQARVSSGVERLDAMLGSGYFRGSSVLITGSAGTGKSILAGAFAEAACLRKERTFYLSFDENPSEVVRDLSTVGILLDPHLKSGVLRMLSARTEASSAEVQLVKIKRIVREYQSRCMVVDPLSAIVKAGAALTAGRVAERCAPAPLGLF